LIKFKINKFTESSEYKKRVLWIIALLAILSVLFFANPEKIYLTKCLFHKTTGYSCPSCGLSRSLYTVSHFELAESIHFHPIGPIIYFAILVLLVKFSIEIIARKEIQLKVEPIIVKISLIIFLGLWISFCFIRFVNEL